MYKLSVSVRPQAWVPFFWPPGTKASAFAPPILPVFDDISRWADFTGQATDIEIHARENSPDETGA